MCFLTKVETQHIVSLQKCRGEKTRTSGLYVPNVARYQLRHTPSDLRLQKYTFFEIKAHSGFFYYGHPHQFTQIRLNRLIQA